MKHAEQQKRVCHVCKRSKAVSQFGYRKRSCVVCLAKASKGKTQQDEFNKWVKLIGWPAPEKMS